MTEIVFTFNESDPPDVQTISLLSQVMKRAESGEAGILGSREAIVEWFHHRYKHQTIFIADK